MLGEIDMFIKDGIAYAGDASPALKICGVRPLADWKLWVRFNTGEAKIIDFSWLRIFQSRPRHLRRKATVRRMTSSTLMLK